uniref:Uncharacterized protein n=1 Tax=Mimivirus LCMiAC01 TaxID=2506608 RepID=A0A481Z092_9VIRU|nr:MAG: hypothetical protein LCMiAC01_05210 [Mimivirus LCMiAC01]
MATVLIKYTKSNLYNRKIDKAMKHISLRFVVMKRMFFNRFEKQKKAEQQSSAYVYGNIPMIRPRERRGGPRFIQISIKKIHKKD